MPGGNPFVPAGIAAPGRHDVDGVALVVVVEGRGLVGDAVAVDHTAGHLGQPGVVVASPLDFAGVQIEGCRPRLLALARLALDVGHPVVARHHVARRGRFDRPQRRAGIGAEGAHGLLVRRHHDVGFVQHFERAPGRLQDAADLAAGGVEFDQSVGDDREQPVVRDHRPGHLLAQAGQLEGGIVHRAFAEVAVPEPQAVEAVAGEDAAVEIAAAVGDHALDFAGGGRDPADAFRRAHGGVAGDRVSVGGVARVGPGIHGVRPRLGGDDAPVPRLDPDESGGGEFGLIDQIGGGPQCSCWHEHAEHLGRGGREVDGVDAVDEVFREGKPAIGGQGVGRDQPVDAGPGPQGLAQVGQRVRVLDDHLGEEPSFRNQRRRVVDTGAAEPDDEATPQFAGAPAGGGEEQEQEGEDDAWHAGTVPDRGTNANANVRRDHARSGSDANQFHERLERVCESNLAKSV